MIDAVASGDIAKVRSLINAGADVNAKDNWDGKTALMWVSDEGYSEVVKLLRSAGERE